MSNEGNEFDFENEILSFKSNVNDFTKSNGRSSSTWKGLA